MPGLRVVPAAAFGAGALEAFLAAIEGKTAPRAGLATGNTPVALYRAAQAAVASGSVSLGHVRPFAIDEYVCAPDHFCANRAFFARYWQSIPGAAPVAQFDPAAPDLDAEAVRFAACLRADAHLDLAVLGIGLNGHVAFNEPGSTASSSARLVQLTEETRRSAAACFGPAPPAQGLTLGLHELLGARVVLLLANGRAKASIVARALQGPVGKDCPASFIQDHPRAVVVLDESAAADLHG